MTQNCGFSRAMENYAVECRSRGLDLILCGDMNVTRTDQDVHPKERKPDVIGQRPDERALFERVLANGGMVDVGRALDPDNDRLFTWWPPWRNMRQNNIGWRLDYILAGRAAADRIPRCSVLAETGTSDHAPVVADVSLPASVRGFAGPHSILFPHDFRYALSWILARPRAARI